MHCKLESRVGATRMAWLSLSSLFVCAWNRVAGVSVWPNPLMIKCGTDNVIGLKSCLNPFVLDLLIGNAGDDPLKGGANSNNLIDGAGNYTYVVNTGDGYDTFLDSDGSGSIIFNGLTLSGGALVSGTTNVWKDTTHGTTYTLKGSGASQVLLISKDGSSDGIRVQGLDAVEWRLAA